MSVAVFVAIVAVVLGLIFYAFYRNATYWSSRDIPSPPSKDPISHHLSYLFDYGKPFSDSLYEWTKRYGKYYGILEGWRPVLVVSDPEMIHEIFVKQFWNFYGRKLNPMVADEDRPRVNVFDAVGPRWKRLRTISAPSFSVANLKRIFPLIDDSVQNLVSYLDRAYSKDMPFDIYEYCQELSMDVICRVSMGQRESKLFHNPIIDTVKKIWMTFRTGTFEYFAHCFPAVAKLLFKLRELVSPPPASAMVQNLYRIIEERKKLKAEKAAKGTEDDSYIDYIDLFLEAEDPNVKEGDFNQNSQGMKISKKMTTDEIMSSCMVFLLAGFDTTANTLGLTFYLLAKHPQFQERLYDEIMETCGEGDVEFEHLNKLKLCDAAMKETLRLFPIGEFAASRACKVTSTVCGVEIEKGVFIMPDVYGLHYSKDTWGPDAEQFNPDRFFSLTPTQKMAWIPFGAGPRVCIGLRLSEMEERTALARILRKYKLVQVPETDSEFGIIGTTVLNPKKVIVKLEKRV